MAVADSDLLEAIKVLARAHESLIWTRQRLTNQLRSALRDYFPGALVAFDDLRHADALSVLQAAPTPTRARVLTTTQIKAALKRGGRRRNLGPRASEIHQALGQPQLAAAELVEDAYGSVTAAQISIITELNTQIAAVEAQLEQLFSLHPDAKLLLCLPGQAQPYLNEHITALLPDPAAPEPMPQRDTTTHFWPQEPTRSRHAGPR